MKKLEINMDVVRDHGAVAAVALAIVEKEGKNVTNTSVSLEMGVTFPTAKKTLMELAKNNLIKQVGKEYAKI